MRARGHPTDGCGCGGFGVWSGARQRHTTGETQCGRNPRCARFRQMGWQVCSGDPCRAWLQKHGAGRFHPCNLLGPQCGTRPANFERGRTPRCARFRQIGSTEHTGATSRPSPRRHGAGRAHPCNFPGAHCGPAGAVSPDLAGCGGVGGGAGQYRGQKPLCRAAGSGVSARRFAKFAGKLAYVFANKPEPPGAARRGADGLLHAFFFFFAKV